MIFNASIAVGVNFATREVFDQVFVYYEKDTSLRDLFQALYRTRHPRNLDIFGVLACVYNHDSRNGRSRNTIALDEDNSDDRWKSMRQSLQVEYQGCGRIVICCEYAKKANIKLIPVNIDVMKEAQAVGSVILQAYNEDILYDRQGIDKIDVAAQQLIRKRQGGEEITFENQLSLHRYYFEKKLSPVTPDEVLEDCWWSLQDLASLIRLKKQPNDTDECARIIHDILAAFDIDMDNNEPYIPTKRYNNLLVSLHLPRRQYSDNDISARIGFSGSCMAAEV